MFKPKIKPVEVEDGGETVSFFVREPSGREILEQAGKQKKDATATENARELFSRFVVHEDGTPVTSAEVDEMLDARLTAMHKMSNKVQEVIGLAEITAKKT